MMRTVTTILKGLVYALGLFWGEQTTAQTPSGTEAISPEATPQTAQGTTAQPPSGKEAQPPEDDPKKTKLQIETADGNFVVRPNLLLQPVITVPLDSETKRLAEGSGLQMKRANFGVRGTIFKLASYRLWVGYGKGSAKLIDAWVDINPWEGALVVRMGWFAPHFGRQRLSSSSKLQFVEPALAWTDRILGLNLNRDMGITIYGTLANSIEWAVGASNGENSYTLDDNRDYDAALRLLFHPLAAFGVGENLKTLDMTTLKKRHRPALAFGGSVMVTRRTDRTISLDDTSDPAEYKDAQVKLGGEMGFGWSRLNVSTEFFWMKTVLDDALDAEVVSAIRDQLPSADTHGSGMGAYLQTGIMIVDDLLEIAGRFDWVDEHNRTPGSRFYPAFATNLYFREHHLKLQIFYRATISHGYDNENPNWRDSASHLLEMMLQLCF